MSFSYAMKEGWSGIKRQKLAALGSIFTVTISLLLLGMFYTIAFQLSQTIKQIRSQVDVEVFLRDPVGKNKLVEIQRQIETLDGIQSAEFVSKEEAAEFFKKEFGEDINKVLDFNPLPSSFKITLLDAYRTSERVEALQQKLKAIKGVDDVTYRKDMLAFFDSRTQKLNMLALGIGIFLAFTSIVLISNSIRLTIVARKNAIRIMKLVGATRWFVRAPFIIEGILLGCIGGMFASGLLFYFINLTKEVLPIELTSFANSDILVYLAIVGIGAVLGLFGSMVAARKYIGESVI